MLEIDDDYQVCYPSLSWARKLQKFTCETFHRKNGFTELKAAGLFKYVSPLRGHQVLKV